VKTRAEKDSKKHSEELEVATRYSLPQRMLLPSSFEWAKVLVGDTRIKQKVSIETPLKPVIKKCGGRVF
jgi:hypothetical protein